MNQNKRIKIAFIVPVCSRGQNWARLEQTHFTTKLFKSFLNTTTQDQRESKYEFKFFLGCDDDDVLFSQERIIAELSDFTLNYGVHSCMYRFGDTKSNPVQAWNHLAKIAYDQGFDYFYQTGDDVEMKNAWADQFIEALQKTNNIGVAAPKDIGYYGLYTQSFVHRTHLDIMGSYYPDVFKNWYCDDFITGVYKPNYNHYLENIHIKNTGGAQRYAGDDAQKYLPNAVAEGMKKLKKWVNITHQSELDEMKSVFVKYEEISETMTTAPAKPYWSTATKIFDAKVINEEE